MELWRDGYARSDAFTPRGLGTMVCPALPTSGPLRVGELQLRAAEQVVGAFSADLEVLGGDSLGT